MVQTGQNATLYAGNKLILDWPVKVSNATSAAAQDLTGLIVKFAVARFGPNNQPLKDNPLIDHRTDTSSQLEILAPATDGNVRFTFAPSDTSSLTPGNYYMELEVFSGTNTDGIVSSTGTLTILQNVTNA